MAPTIEMSSVSKTFKDKTVLNNINFSVNAGEILGLLGPSGAGKTTIIKLLTGQLKPTSGSAKLMGQNSTALTNAIYARIGMVLEESGVYKRLSVIDNMSMFALIYGTNKTHINTVLEKVGLQNHCKQPAEKLSKGMLQRLVLARAILHEPDLLFLDEPTSGLDPSTARSIHALIREQQARGCTVFLTTHNMEEAASLCNTVLLLHEGNIIEQGTPDALCLKYNQNKNLQIRLKDGRQLYLENSSTSAEQISDLFFHEKVETIHSSEPNLENVFLALTGRKLA